MKRLFFGVSLAGLVALATFNGGCGGSTTTTTVNTNSAGIPVNSAVNAVNVNSTPVPTPTPVAVNPVIETREPDEYRATMRLSGETTGKTAVLPSLEADVARSGDRRRVSINMPNNEQVIYMNLGETRYIVLPGRKQYAEINRDAVGFEMPSLMMPDQIIEYLKSRQGFERVGEEQMNNRTVVKYRAAGAAQTNSAAGQVSGESFTFVDKETGLPVRTEMVSQASGNAQGVQGLKAVIEMRDIKTDVAPSLFEVPTGYNKITEDQIRTQVSAVTQTIAAIAGAVMNSMRASP